MPNDATVTAADIARLAAVGRAAVSNWRRRHDDFPQPVGGTAVSPTFSLTEVEDWLRGQGKLADSPVRERVWQTLRTAASEGRDLADVLTFAGAFLLHLRADPARWDELPDAPDDEVAAALPEVVQALPGGVEAAPGLTPPSAVPLVRALSQLVDELGAVETFEFLRTRYLEHHSRRVYLTPEPVVRLMLELGGPARTVLDPACGTGTYLKAADEVFEDVRQLLGQEIDDTTARMSAIQLALRGAPAEVCPGDSLLADAFPGRTVDLVVSNPPFNDRGWGYEQLTGDPRWEYGLPPRMESELAWLQHGLAHVEPGGHVVLLMPPAVANRRSGRRVRSELLRRGTLRAVIGLPPGAVPNMAVALAVWVLRRPAPGGAPADDVLMVDTSADPDNFRKTALDAWRRYEKGKPTGTDSSVVVRIIDLLDDEVDLTPARYLPQRSAPTAEGSFVAARELLETKAAELPRAVAELASLTQARARADVPMTTVGELAKAGVLQILRPPAKVRLGEGNVPVLTLEDIALGQDPTGTAAPDDEHVHVAAGDVVVSLAARHPVARVITEEGPVLGPGLALVRAEPSRSDPDFVAGWLLLGAQGARLRSSTSSARFDVRRARLPRLGLDEQAEIGREFRRLTDLEAALRDTYRLGADVLRLGLEGLGAGTLRPSGGPR
ncbi:N-6 DNA methylase [Actinomadura bangladeshensis]|uniref:N-6 DNA methylase n=1 Tax=Actinomadura bangladeshensis TaxID=453573 RepID=A0A4R4PAQ6_9ACTN|nr:N-6 DNA methylase [Actinomadura bangladeshensis]TDC19648.1 N-6 DNA methylase [Actinomadura bangladeshensis]